MTLASALRAAGPASVATLYRLVYQWFGQALMFLIRIKHPRW